MLTQIRVLTIGLLVILLNACSGALAAPSTQTVTPDAPGGPQTDRDLDAQEEAVVASHGAGALAVEPDIARLEVLVARNAETSNSAIIALTDALNVINARADELGIQERRVLVMAVWPGSANKEKTPGKTFTAEAKLALTLPSIKDAPGMIESLLLAGVTQVEQISFDTSQRAALLEDARALALQDAEQNARSLAAAANSALGDLLYLSHYDENEPFAPLPYEEIPVLGGSLLAPQNMVIRADVYVKYELIPNAPAATDTPTP